MKIVKTFLVLTMSTSILVACSNKVTQEAENVAKKNELNKQEKENKEKNDKEELTKLYKNLERPIEEVIEANEKEVLHTVDTKVINKDKYEDPSMFSKKVAEVMFNFYSGDLSPEGYCSFLENHGSKSIIEELIPNQKDGILFAASVQQLILDETKKPSQTYQISELKFNEQGTEAYFYRKVLLSENENDYYISTIVKEDGIWKFQDDKPSQPYTDANGSITETKQENITKGEK